jgi:hypothetical protein
VISEEHQQAETEEKQHDRAAHRKPRETGGAVAAGHADRVQPGRAVGKGRDKGTENDLVRPVTQEVAQQPGRELGGRQLQRHHRQAQQQRDDRHHRAGDRNQQIAGIIGGPLERQRRAHPNVDDRKQRPRSQGTRHRQRGQHPQRSPSIFRKRVTADHAQPPHLPRSLCAGQPARRIHQAQARCWPRPGISAPTGCPKPGTPVARAPEPSTAPAHPPARTTAIPCRTFPKIRAGSSSPSWPQADERGREAIGCGR